MGTIGLNKVNKVISKVIVDNGFPFDWMDLEYYPHSKGNFLTFHCSGSENMIKNTINSVEIVFQEQKNKILIYQDSWWDYCIDTWDIKEDNNNYNYTGKSTHTVQYLKMLKDSHIEFGYSGTCKCNNWNIFLPVILGCLYNNIAPFSPLFYCIEFNYFFYFNNTGEVGIYYKVDNEGIQAIKNQILHLEFEK